MNWHSPWTVGKIIEDAARKKTFQNSFEFIFRAAPQLCNPQDKLVVEVSVLRMLSSTSDELEIIE